MTVQRPEAKESVAPASIAEHPRYIWWKGRRVPWEEATVHATSMGWSAISAVFEGVRAYWNDREERLYLFQLETHLRRLAQSMKLMRMACPYSTAEIREAALDLVRSNGLGEDSYLFPFAYFPGDVPGYLAAPEQPGELFMVARPRASNLLSGRALDCCVSTWRRLSDTTMPPRAKMISAYQNSRIVSTEAAVNGYDTAIILNEQGKVAEAPYACIFIMRNGVAITPPVTAGILESVTRETVMRLLQHELGVAAIEREIDRTELYIADEVFLCGTYAEVTAVASVDRYRVGDGVPAPVTSRLERLYHQVVRGFTPDYAEWRTPV